MQEKKPRRPRAKKITLNTRAQWQRWIKEVDKTDVPIEVIQYVVVNLRDGSRVPINIAQLLAAGHDPTSLDQHLSDRLRELDDYIEDVDYYISVASVARTVQAKTDQLLKDL
jgi:hypothetical protein